MNDYFGLPKPLSPDPEPDDYARGYRDGYDDGYDAHRGLTPADRLGEAIVSAGCALAFVLAGLAVALAVGYRAFRWAGVV